MTTSTTTKTPSPVVGAMAQKIGDPSRSVFSEYLCSDYCFSCAYFQFTKGHFGFCSDMGSKIPYDGTKKGSACGGWRIKSDWKDKQFEIPFRPIVRKRVYQVRGAIIESLGTFEWDSLPGAKRFHEYQKNIKALNKIPEIVNIRPIQNAAICNRCNKSDKVIKFGKDQGKQGYRCLRCLHRFRETNELKSMRYTKNAVGLAIPLILSGKSLREVSREITKLLGKAPSSSTLSRWMKKFKSSEDLSSRQRIGYRHMTEAQKDKQRENVLKHNSLILPNCLCVYHKSRISK